MEASADLYRMTLGSVFISKERDLHILRNISKFALWKKKCIIMVRVLLRCGYLGCETDRRPLCRPKPSRSAADGATRQPNLQFID